MKKPLLSDLAITRLNALKSSFQTPTSTEPKSAEYQQGVNDSLMMIKDLFKSLNIPFNPQYN